MRFEKRLLGMVILPLLAGLSAGQELSASVVQSTVDCAVTTPNGIAAREAQADPWSYGNHQISVGLGWPEGTVVFKPGGSGFLTRNGALGMKFGWQRRSLKGRLLIEGRRLDGDAPPLRYEEPGLASFPVGFNPSYLIFPTPGCWEVTGRVGEASVTFVTRVVKIGDGPAWRRDVP